MKSLAERLKSGATRALPDFAALENAQASQIISAQAKQIRRESPRSGPRTFGRNCSPQRKLVRKDGSTYLAWYHYTKGARTMRVSQKQGIDAFWDTIARARIKQTKADSDGARGS